MVFSLTIDVQGVNGLMHDFTKEYNVAVRK